LYNLGDDEDMDMNEQFDEGFVEKRARFDLVQATLDSLAQCMQQAVDANSACPDNLRVLYQSVLEAFRPELDYLNEKLKKKAQVLYRSRTSCARRTASSRASRKRRLHARSLLLLNPSATS
jgi:hypothetical protein